MSLQRREKQRSKSDLSSFPFATSSGRPVLGLLNLIGFQPDYITALPSCQPVLGANVANDVTRP